MSDKPFKEILIDAIEHKGMSLSKLSETSRVPERYIEFLIRGEHQELPSLPYLHGYIIRLADALDLDGNLLWEVFKRETEIRSSGRRDELPRNRFAIQPTNNAKIISITALSLIVLIYLIFRFNTLFGKPKITIIDPPQEVSTVFSSTFTITGTTDPENKLTINNELLDISSNGFFQKDVLLQEGINNFEIKAKKFLGRESSASRQILFQKPDSPSKPETQPESETQPENSPKNTEPSPQSEN